MDFVWGSHPSRVRELKQLSALAQNRECRSHPSRVRELKHPSLYHLPKCELRRTPPGCVN